MVFAFNSQHSQTPGGWVYLLMTIRREASGSDLFPLVSQSSNRQAISNTHNLNLLAGLQTEKMEVKSFDFEIKIRPPYGHLGQKVVTCNLSGIYWSLKNYNLCAYISLSWWFKTQKMQEDWGCVCCTSNGAHWSCNTPNSTSLQTARRLRLCVSQLLSACKKVDIYLKRLNRATVAKTENQGHFFILTIL